MDRPPPADLLAVAREAAEAGAAVLLPRFGSERATGAKSSPTDMVSEADLASEEAIRAVLATRRPDDGIVGEEGTGDVPGSSSSELGHALVSTGFGYDSDVRRAQAEIVARVLPEVRDIRRAGSAALDLAWLAAGRADAFYERGVKRWDVAAGLLVCSRAGLATRRLDARDALPPGVLVAPERLVEPLLALVG